METAKMQARPCTTCGETVTSPTVTHGTIGIVDAHVPTFTPPTDYSPRARRDEQPDVGSGAIDVARDYGSEMPNYLRPAMPTDSYGAYHRRDNGATA